MPAQVKLLNVNVMELVKHAILANVFAGELPEVTSVGGNEKLSCIVTKW